MIFNISSIIIIILGLVIGLTYYTIIENKAKKKEKEGEK